MTASLTDSSEVVNVDVDVAVAVNVNVNVLSLLLLADSLPTVRVRRRGPESAQPGRLGLAILVCSG